MSQREEKISKLLEFPFDAFLMIRLEYVQILRDELEAKLLRIIEKYVEQERKRIYQKMLNQAGTAPTETLEIPIPRDLWVPISYRLFMNDLFDTVTSENTIKKALRRLAEKKIIFQRYEPQKKYDAPEYRLHIPVLQTLLNVLKNPGYQSLIPSIIDTLKNLPPHEMTPSECQKLIPSNEVARSNSELRVSTNDPNIREGYDNITEITEKERGVSATASTPALTVSLLTEEKCYLYRNGQLIEVTERMFTTQGETHETHAGNDYSDSDPVGVLHSSVYSGVDSTTPALVGTPEHIGGVVTPVSDRAGFPHSYSREEPVERVGGYTNREREEDAGYTTRAASWTDSEPDGNHRSDNSVDASVEATSATGKALPAADEWIPGSAGTQRPARTGVGVGRDHPDGQEAAFEAGSARREQDTTRSDGVRGENDAVVGSSQGRAGQPISDTASDLASAADRPLAGSAKATTDRRVSACIPRRPTREPEEESPKAPPIMPGPDAPWGTRTCARIFDARRGALLIGDYKLNKANSDAKGLASQYSREYVESAIEVISNDPYYKNRFVDIDIVARRIGDYKKQIERKLRGEAEPPPQDRQISRQQQEARTSKRPARDWEAWANERAAQTEAMYAAGGVL